MKMEFKTTTLPSLIDNKLKNNAKQIAKKIVDNLNYIGVMGVEFFKRT